MAKLILGSLGFWTTKALAQFSFGGSGGGGSDLPNPLSCGDLQCVAVKVVGFLLEIAAPLAAIMVLVGGFMMITAAGNPDRFSKGKKTLLYAAIGFVVVLLADGIVQVIRSIFQ